MRRANWVQTAIASWIVISIWPVFSYFFGSSSKSSVQDEALLTAITVDHFAKYNSTPTCSFSSLDLHKPTVPLCDPKDTNAVLAAISGGGRIGTDAPYQTRDCGMRWFSTAEICNILSRFSRVAVIGDSIMRDLAIAFHIFLREDLVDGGRLKWMKDPEGYDCSCEAPWNTRQCVWHVNINSDQVYDQHEELMSCPKVDTAFIKYHTVTAWPFADDQIEGFQSSQFPTKPTKPIAMVFGAGLWNELSYNDTHAWVNDIMNNTKEAMPWLFENNQWSPRLFLTPNAAHAAKNPKYWSKQGNIPLSMFELAIGPWVKREWDIDHLGTFNMSIQASSFDGTHAGMRVNLLKAMGVLNWLNSLDVSKW